MTLQEKIQKKAEGYGKLAPAFLEGAKYALENQWISVEEDLPCNHEDLIDTDKPYFTVFVLALWADGFSSLTKMVKSRIGEWCWTSDVTHWMPIPQPPKE